MTARQAHTAPDLAAPAAPIAWYSVLGVPVALVSDVAEALERVEETYAAFRQKGGTRDGALFVELRREGRESYLVRDTAGYERRWPDSQAALFDLLGRIVSGVLARLQMGGVYAIHAGAVVYRGATLMVAGRSGQGKTTLVLGLLRRGLGLLSDEFAIVEPGTQQILPYRRSLHIRPGTLELIPELRFLRDRPRHQLGGGIEWALTPAELGQAFPGCPAAAAPLRYVLLLDGAPQPDGVPAIAPVPTAVAAMELLRGTWAVSVNFAEGLARIGRLMDGVACGRLRVGALEATLDYVTRWLEAPNG